MNDKLISTEELAEHLSVSVHTINRWRTRGAGPPFVKIGRAVRYRESDVAEWMERQSRESTKES